VYLYYLLLIWMFLARSLTPSQYSWLNTNSLHRSSHGASRKP
jgi:hypothetical protein